MLLICCYRYRWLSGSCCGVISLWYNDNSHNYNAVMYVPLLRFKGELHYLSVVVILRCLPSLLYNYYNHLQNMSCEWALLQFFQCDRTESLRQYFGTVFSPNPTVLGLLGCGCSVASTPVAEIVQYNSISQVKNIPLMAFTTNVKVTCVNSKVHSKVHRAGSGHWLGISCPPKCTCKYLISQIHTW